MYQPQPYCQCGSSVRILALPVFSIVLGKERGKTMNGRKHDECHIVQVGYMDCHTQAE